MGTGWALQSEQQGILKQILKGTLKRDDRIQRLFTHCPPCTSHPWFYSLDIRGQCPFHSRPICISFSLFLIMDISGFQKGFPISTPGDSLRLSNFDSFESSVLILNKTKGNARLRLLKRQIFFQLGFHESCHVSFAGFAHA